MMANYLATEHKYPEAIQAAADATETMANYNMCHDSKELWIETDEQQRNLPRAIASVVEANPSNSCLVAMLQQVVRFYNGVCRWEGTAKSSVFSSDWARNCIACINLFPAEIRIQVANESMPLDNQKMRALVDACKAKKLDKSAMEMLLTAAPHSRSSDVLASTAERRGTKRRCSVGEDPTSSKKHRH